MNLKTKKVVGVEALIRWNSEALGFVPPDEFIPVAEQKNLINELGFWVIEEACQSYQKWVEKGLIKHGFQMAINVSPLQLKQKDFFKKVQKIIKKYQVKLEDIDFELIESAISMADKSLNKALSFMKKNDLAFSIDDFGTGYSSLSRLGEMPIDTLKIDKSFVSKISEDSVSEAIILAIIGLGKSLGLKVIAEGVETQRQKDFLSENGCLYAQGYFYSKPLPEDEARKLLKKK